MNVIQNRGTAAEQEVVTATESANEEVYHITCLVILLLGGIPTMSSFRHLDPYMLSATHADAAHVWSHDRSSTIPMTSGTRIAEHRRSIVVSRVHVRHPRIALDLFLGTIKTLT